MKRILKIVLATLVAFCLGIIPGWLFAFWLSCAACTCAHVQISEPVGWGICIVTALISGFVQLARMLGK